VRRWTLLLAGAALWLFLAAIPALADGGPHVSSVNSGTSNLTADSCAGCHRAHTAQGEMLLTAPTEEELCLQCHGAASTGATTDVMTGVQYAINSANGLRGGTALGALRGGGFDQARISSGNPARVIFSNQMSSSDDQWAKVSVLANAQDVTSAHLNLAENGLSAPGVAWGNGAIGAGDTGPGPGVNLTCGSCHNPHGNGQYRILNPIPDPDVSSGTFTPVAAPGAAVRDSSIDPDGNSGNGIANPTKNYTVVQVKGTAAGASSYLLYASDVLDARGLRTKTWPAGDYSATSGDYWHVRVPWSSESGTTDAPNGIPATSVGRIAFQDQMTAWCSTCHTRYMSTTAKVHSGDALFAYRHPTLDKLACTTCHVAHGSNARMEGTFSSTMPFPDGSTPSYVISTTTGDSRLLKVDNRGTCQMCHDPTYTEDNGQYRGPTSTPGVP
jgi:predicted CXXCH cytochrome family protein